MYSFSFEPNPNWTRLYPGQEEMLAYLVRVAQKWDLYQHIRFSTEVTDARWDETTQNWYSTLKVTNQKEAERSPEYVFKSDFLVSAVGQLNQPSYPRIKGIDSFKSKVMHSARWDWSYQLEGKHIAVIGNGATAAQIIPEITKIAKSVTIYQRTPNWIAPRADSGVSSAVRWVFRNVPFALVVSRTMMMDFRERLYRVVSGEEVYWNNLTKQLHHQGLNKEIDDKALRKKLVPNYPPGCKRIIVSDDYFHSLNRPHVKLETDPIEEITETGITAGGQNRDFDLIILATGFKTNDFMYPIQVTGSGGKPLQDVWKHGAEAYLGVMVESMPNFAMLYGPNTNLGHNSIILMIEAQSRYINTLIAPVLKARSKGGALSIVPNSNCVRLYNDDVQERLKKTIFVSPECNSWYKTESGIVVNNWHGTVVQYQVQMSSVDWTAYVLAGTGGEELVSKKKQYIGRVVEETRVSPKTILAASLAGAAIIVGYKYGYPRLQQR